MASGKGTTTVDFGSFPGKTDAQLVITGQASIGAGSYVEAWLVPTATADHSADEHWVDGPIVMAGNVVAGTGFTIYARMREMPPVIDDQRFQATNTYRAGTAPNYKGPQTNKVGANMNTPMCYGLWTVAWVWSD